MKIRFLIAGLVILGLTAPISPVQASEATFEAKTDPSWLGPTMSGEWKTGEDRARLQMGGGHFFPSGSTRFVGTWTTSLLRKQAAPSIAYRFTFDLVNDLGHLKSLRFLVRSRKSGKAWSRWDVTRIDPSSTSHSLSGNGDYTRLLESAKRARFQWRIQGRIDGPTAVRGDIEVNSQ